LLRGAWLWKGTLMRTLAGREDTEEESDDAAGAEDEATFGVLLDDWPDSGKTTWNFGEHAARRTKQEKDVTLKKLV